MPPFPPSGRSDALPRWSVLGAVRALKGWAWRNAFLRRARVMAWEVGGKWSCYNKRFAWFWELNLDKNLLDDVFFENEKNGGKLCKWVMIIWWVVFMFTWYFKWVFVCGKICRFLQRWCERYSFFQVCKFAVNPYGFVSWFFAAWKIIQSLCHGKPPWLASRMHAAVGAQRLLVRVSMCLLHSFSQVFGEQVQYVLFASHVKMVDESMQQI